MKWKYGNAWEEFPIEAGEVWGLPSNGSKVAVHNIFDPLPDFMKAADLIFVDPPWNRGNVNTFYTKAGLTPDDHIKDFKDFENAVFGAIESIGPETVYIEIGKQNVDSWYARLKTMYPACQKWDVVYYKKHLTYIIRGSNEPIDYDFTGIDEAQCIKIIGEIETYKCLGDFCMGQGLVGMAAFSNNRPFVGTELNKRRLANLLQKVHKAGGIVDRYE